ncbi:MAG: hypothetical protein LBI96_05570 [Odoribacteraceae bacterium]|jgi:hypothetical protein|nr:hypothetical protein [Odoribacteraceae bacterium]
MKHIAIIGIALLMMACAKEETPLPSEVKNWFEITPTPGMDEVDQKIYAIWSQHRVGIFYNDTIGREDYGMVDTLGNPVYQYRVLQVTADMSASVYASWTRLNVKTPTDKQRLLPLLEFLDNVLLPIAEEVGIDVPAILLTQTFQQQSPVNRAWKVFRGANVIVIPLGPFSDAPAIQKEYKIEFLFSTMGQKFEADLAPYYAAAEEAVRATGYAGTIWSYMFSQFVSNYYEIHANMNFIENYATQMATLQSQLATLKAAYEAPGAPATAADAYARKIQEIVTKQGIMDNEQIWRNSFARYRPEAFGFLGLNSPAVTTSISSTPSKLLDVVLYFTLLVNNSMADLESAYGEFPLVMERFRLLQEFCSQHHIDIDAWR